MSETEATGMRRVMRSFFAKPPVSTSRPGVSMSPSARPRSTRVFVDGLICAQTWLR